MTENDQMTSLSNALRIPPYEGRHVQATSMKITGAMPMDELEGTVVSIDDVVTMVCQFRVVNVHHNTDAKGNIIRLQVLRPVLMALAPMNPEDPDDDGIVRAMPEIVESKVEPVCSCDSADTTHDRTCMLVRLLGMESALEEGERMNLSFTPAPAPAIGTGQP